MTPWHSRPALAALALLLAACAGPRPAPGTDSPYAGLHTELAAHRAAEKSGPVAELPPEVAASLLPPLALELPKAPERRFDIDVREVDARTFFMSLLHDSAENIVVHPAVAGTLTLSLRNVTVADVLASVRDVYGYDVRRGAAGWQVFPAAPAVAHVQRELHQPQPRRPHRDPRQLRPAARRQRRGRQQRQHRRWPGRGQPRQQPDRNHHQQQILDRARTIATSHRRRRHRRGWRAGPRRRQPRRLRRRQRRSRRGRQSAYRPRPRARHAGGAARSGILPPVAAGQRHPPGAARGQDPRGRALRRLPDRHQLGRAGQAGQRQEHRRRHDRRWAVLQPGQLRDPRPDRRPQSGGAAADRQHADFGLRSACSRWSREPSTTSPPSSSC